jgi:hypothetical protein
MQTNQTNQDAAALMIKKVIRKEWLCIAITLSLKALKN